MAIANTAGEAEARLGKGRAFVNWFFNRKAVPIWALIGFFSLAFWPTYLYWWDVWTMYQSAFGYGYLVPPTVLFLIWCRREQIAEAPKSQGRLWILIPIILAVLLHSAALIARVNIVQSFAFFVLLMSVPYLIWGPAVYRLIWGALAYTATMLPWPPQIYATLLLPAREISTKVAVKMLQWAGLSVNVEHNTLVSTNNYQFEVAAACSGLTIVFPVVAIVILSVMMIRAPSWKIVLLLLMAVPLSVFANAVRIWTIAMIGEHWGADLANRLHDPSGVAAVIFATVLLTIIMSLMKCMDYKPEYVPAFARAPEDEEEKA